MAIALDSKTEKVVRTWAKKKDLEPRQALDKLIETALNRLAALTKYQKSPKGIKAAKRAKAQGKPKKVSKMKRAA